MKGLNIVVFSPQRWGHIHISKHHYALELAKENNVWFVSAPEECKSDGCTTYRKNNGFLHVVHYSLFLPDFVKFKLPSLYKNICSRKLGRLLKELTGTIDLCIDFGCYQFFNDLDFIQAKRKIYFPVDDLKDLKVTNRGAQSVYTVSTIIQEKFIKAGLTCEFINHGLNDTFEELARRSLSRGINDVSTGSKLKVCYAGNLFLKFLDIPVLKQILLENPDVEFHFFGPVSFNERILEQVEWAAFLDNCPNAILHGQVNSGQLANWYQQMDLFILIYKPDYLNFHGENSHKILEYLSAGKAIVSSYLSIYKDSTIINMAPKDRNDLLPSILSDTLKNIAYYNNSKFQKERILLALVNTYKNNIGKIFNDIYGQVVSAHLPNVRKENQFEKGESYFIEK